MLTEERVVQNETLPATLHAPDQFQQQVIASREHSIRVLAPAGSGKTETLGRRIQARIAEGTPPNRILVLTFDRNANAAFLATLDRVGITRRPEVRTLNAFGLNILRRSFPDERADIRSRFYGPEQDMLGILMDETDHAAMMDLFSTLKSHLFDPRALDKKKAARWIEEHYERLVPQKFLDSYPARTSASRFARDLVAEFAGYERFLTDQRIIDFDDQKLRAWVRLNEAPEIVERIQAAYDEIIIDEFQDINALDVALIHQIAAKATLVVTGDDDQAIYGFRWATPEYLIDPDKIFKRTFTSYELAINYRCPPDILSHATALIRHNKTRVPKAPTSGATEPGSIEHIAKADRIAEANAIRLRVIELLRNDPALTFDDIGVLYRRNEQHYPVQVQLFRTGIPYRVAEQFDMRQQWRTALQLLDVSTMLRAGPRGAPQVTATDLRSAIQAFRGFRYLSEDNRSALLRQAVAEGPLQLDVLVSAAKQAAGDYQGRMFETAIRKLRTAKTIGAELDVIESEFVGAARRRGKPNERGDDDSALGVLKDVLGSKPTNRAGSIERLRTFLQEGQSLAAMAPGAVELSTCHGAKGRQWKIVVLPSVNEGIVPDPLTRTDQGELEGERRLFYVAMTRAARHLIIGHSDTSREPAPSRFLYEAGLDDLPPHQFGMPEPPARVRSTAPTPVRKQQKTPLARSSSSTPPAVGAGGAANSRSAFLQGRVARRKAPAGAVRIVPIGGEPVDLDPTDDAAVAEVVAWAKTTQIGIHYQHSLLTWPLQFALLVAGVPFLVALEDRLIQSAEMRSLYALLVGPNAVGLDVAEQEAGKADSEIVAAMARQARAQAKTRDELKVLLDRAIERAARHGSSRARIVFRKVSASS